MIEDLRIQAFSNYLAYVSIVGRQNPILFTLKENSNGKLVFENLEHDFPKRIIYHRQKDGSLQTRIEDDDKAEGFQLLKVR